MNKLYIIRHGQTDWNLEGRYAGRIDVPLNDKGIEQANIIKEELSNVEFDKVFSSIEVREKLLGLFTLFIDASH